MSSEDSSQVTSAAEVVGSLDGLYGSKAKNVRLELQKKEVSRGAREADALWSSLVGVADVSVLHARQQVGVN